MSVSNPSPWIHVTLYIIDRWVLLYVLPKENILFLDITYDFHLMFSSHST